MSTTTYQPRGFFCWSDYKCKGSVLSKGNGSYDSCIGLGGKSLENDMCTTKAASDAKNLNCWECWDETVTCTNGYIYNPHDPSCGSGRLDEPVNIQDVEEGEGFELEEADLFELNSGASAEGELEAASEQQ
eukprot:tig00021254_g19699.t1